MELHCHYCDREARAVLVDGIEWVCDSCGTILDTPELYDMSHPYLHTGADTDIPLKYRNTKTNPVVFIEREYGRSTRAVRKKPQTLTPIIDSEAVAIRIEQRNLIKDAIVDIAEKLYLQPEKVLNRFESYVKKIPLMGFLKTDNIITNKRHKRAPNVVAAGLIFKVYRNKVTIRQLKKVAGCGNKSLQKILRLI